MAVASLVLKLNDVNKHLILETGSLPVIDEVTMKYLDQYDLLQSPQYSDKTMDFIRQNNSTSYSLVLDYVKSNDEKLSLKIIYNESPIITKVESLESDNSESEVARKLLFSSKDGLFLSLFLQNQGLSKTIYPMINIDYNEFKLVKEAGISAFDRGGYYSMTVGDVLRYRLLNKQLGIFRHTFEDALELWKNNLLNMSDEDLYYYSRELRRLISDYEYRKIPRRPVCNLCIDFKCKEKIQRGFTLQQKRSIEGIKMPKRKTYDDFLF